MAPRSDARPELRIILTPAAEKRSHTAHPDRVHYPVRVHPLSRRCCPRLRGFPYDGPCTYFITVITAGRRQLLAETHGDKFQLLPIGQLLVEIWHELPQHPPGAEPLDHVVMPDHFHGIVRVTTGEPGSLWRTIGGIKGEVTRQARRRGIMGLEPLWARSFHDQIIRDEPHLRQVQRYIEENPARWIGKWRHGTED